jgi:hypothetical protein
MKSAQEIEIRLFSKGGPSTKISAKPLGRFYIKVTPSGYLGTDEEGKITITGSDLNLDRFDFELEYRYKFGGQHRTMYSYNLNKGQINEDENGA